MWVHVCRDITEISSNCEKYGMCCIVVNCFERTPIEINPTPRVSWVECGFVGLLTHNTDALHFYGRLILGSERLLTLLKWQLYRVVEYMCINSVEHNSINLDGYVYG